MPAGNATAWLVPDIDKYAALLNIYSNTGIYALTDTNNTSARGQYGAVEEESTAPISRPSSASTPWACPPRRRRRAPRQHQSGIGRLCRRRRRDPEGRGQARIRPDPAVVQYGRRPDRRRGGPLQRRQDDCPSGHRLAVPGGDVAVQGANRSFSSGNPYLDPTKSKNVDLSLEWYPSSGTMLAAGFFFKRIDTFVATLRQEASTTPWACRTRC
jgi:iron complex outermembrane receptor protein